MPTALDRFDKSSQKVLDIAEEEARRLGHSSIGTEHILLALALSEDLSLHSAGITDGEIRVLIDILSKSDDPPASGQLTLTRHAQNVVVRAISESRKFNGKQVRAYHLLMGIIEEPNSLAMIILSLLGEPPESMKRRLRILAEEERRAGRISHREERRQRERLKQLPNDDELAAAILQARRENQPELERMLRLQLEQILVVRMERKRIDLIEELVALERERTAIASRIRQVLREDNELEAEIDRRKHAIEAEASIAPGRAPD